MDDLDQSGHGFQRVRTYLGPSLGWKEEFVLPTTDIRTGGTYTVKPGDSLLLVDVAAIVTIQLPDVRDWVQQNANQPATGFERSIGIKDLGGNAHNFNIIIVPFAQQAIDNLQQALVLDVARANVKLSPLIDMSGWLVEASSAGTGGGTGGGDVFKAGDNTFTATNTFVGPITVPTVLTGDNSNNAASTAWVKGQTYLTNAAGTAAFQPLDADLTSLAGQSASGVMFYRSGPGVWSTVAIGANMDFTGGVLSSTGGGSGGAPIGAQYVVAALDGTLTNERLLTDSATISWDFSTPGVVQANSSAGGGNVSTSGTPTVNQLAQWVTSTTIKGINISALGFQPLDGDLTALSGLIGTNTIYYRSATDIWSPVTFSGLSFSGGVLTVTAGGGNVNSSGVPTLGQVAEWTNLNTIKGASNVPHYYSQNTTPAVGNAGDLWYNIDTGVLCIFVNDGNTSQWVQISPSVSPPAAAGFAGVNVQTFTASGTYTPTVGMKYCQIECVGGGGGGGGIGDSTSVIYGGAGGGSGGYSRKTSNAAAIGASQVVTVGAAGAGATGTGGTTTGSAGGVTSVGGLCIANGGNGGPGSSVAGVGAGGLGGTPGTGDIVAAGNPGGANFGFPAGSNLNAGANGGASFFGGGGRGYGPSSGSNSGVGGAGLNYGAGGGGACGLNIATGRAGGAGSAGVVIITEYF